MDLLQFYSCAVDRVLFELWCVMYCNVMDRWKDVQMPCRFTITPDCTKCALMRRGTVYIYSDMGSAYCTHSWMDE